MLKRIFLIAVVVVLAIVAFEWLTFPDVAALAKENPSTTAFMEARKAELRSEGKDDTLLHDWTPYARISPYLRRGVLVAEDDTFYQHGGVDVNAMKDAIRRDWQRKKMTHGGSTITQQLAKNLYLSPSRNPLRKIKEYFIAQSLERHLSKKRILELYLNVVEMGERVYGAEAAAKFYFHRSASALTPQQAALLAGCLPNPQIMNPAAPNKRLRFRQRMILSRMRRWGYLMEEEVLTEKKPAAASTDTALQQTPPTDTATPAPTIPSGSSGPGGTGGATTVTTGSATTETTTTQTTATGTTTTETTATSDTAAAPPPAQAPSSRSGSKNSAPPPPP